jgi:DNA topoisomerase I
MLKKVDDPRDPHVAAMLADLNYASDDVPGIARRRSGKGFAYFSPSGKRVTDGETVARINSLAIPPAYRDVWISTDPNGHLQATGRDEKGRKQYRYHPRWAAVRDEAKYGNLLLFGHALPELRARIEQDLSGSGLTRERVIASVVWLLENTMIRVGNQTYARENKSFGLTTLRDRHVTAVGGRLRFKFKGKSGKEWDLELTDRRIVRIVRGAQDLPGQHLFQYLDEKGERRPVHSHDVNDYLRQIGGFFTAKHFRTWGGTQSAAFLLAAEALPETQAMAARRLNAIIDEVAHRLGNTRAVCRKAYIHPRVITHWSDGRLVDGWSLAKKSFRKPLAGLDPDEMLLLKWLEATAEV